LLACDGYSGNCDSVFREFSSQGCEQWTSSLNFTNGYAVKPDDWLSISRFLREKTETFFEARDVLAMTPRIQHELGEHDYEPKSKQEAID